MIFQTLFSGQLDRNEKRYTFQVTDLQFTQLTNKVTGYIPPREAAHDIFEGNADAQKMAELDAIAIGGVINAKARVFMPDIQAKMQAMLQGELTPEEATKEAAEAIEASFQ